MDYSPGNITYLYIWMIVLWLLVNVNVIKMYDYIVCVGNSSTERRR